MTMSNDYDFIKNKFDSDGTKAPESLSEDAVMAMLPDLDETASEQFIKVTAKEFHEETAAAGYHTAAARTPLLRQKKARRWVAAVACALIALIGIPPLYDLATGAPDTELVNGELRTFGSYGEIRRLVESLDDSTPGFRLFRLGRTDLAVEEEMAESDGSAAAKSDSAAGSTAAPLADSDAAHSETYLQVEEVDEADIVKTDGKYIYYVNQDMEVVILSASKGKTEKVATIGNNGVENYVDDIFLKGDTLVTVGRVYDEDDGYTAVVTYDISDRSHPDVTGEYRQSGDVVSSRMVGDCVYLVTCDYVYGKRIIPKCTLNGTYSDIPVEDIACVPHPNQKSYVILSAVDISEGKGSKGKSKAVFGASNTIYCNDHNLYAAVTQWDGDADDGRGAYSTLLMRASINGLDIKWNGTASVRGNVYGQFAMDEKDGYFRIATTGQRNGIDVNNLFVLDSKLKTVGKVTGFARNESIKSVRFLGDKAYVVTYEAIDPLFVIDLSRPEDPRIDGEVKIDGFSSLLLPVAEDRLLGIGYATGDNGYGGEYAAGLKLTLFDISDPSKPEVADSKEFKDMDSPVQYDHHALVVNKEKGWFAFPYGIYHFNEAEDDLIIEDIEAPEEDAEEDAGETESDDEIMVDAAEPDYGYEAGVLVFGADDKLEVYDQHKLGNEYLLRSVYIGDYIYSLDSNGESFNFRFTK